MISQFAHEYLHSNSVGNLAICQETIQKTEEMLEAIYSAKNIRGYRLLIIKSAIDVQDELLEGLFEGVTKGKFPFVYSFIQPTEKSEVDFDKLMEELHYIRVNDD
ncbi:MAG TPA: hypothetical protein DEG17_08000 [Cyanobacteria bacterium UBA11149]|nr:hypothetical protein [Cyanobacteria bacterium UBA11367]HBE56739.1 hypothetical protein [Cyanobacteria bacterium UBA11366]HBK64762.1 hypothetical protein [Cyanobacteria bacterium UBA11166]HBR76230.1 hypothetical protein [Cyanobacteria bacterium UBA11159]HBS71299.1 hypothetical protein [Cyanobacteria bacterium UBA11153]HBW88804.1 hypothetical protein [Cyanobacteria bacterium UBA11149]HCA96943.1 hypothetical protein [Cyanobacteria bacterium UBA9226]